MILSLLLRFQQKSDTVERRFFCLEFLMVYSVFFSQDFREKEKHIATQPASLFLICPELT